MDTLNPSYNQVLIWAVLAPMNGISLPSGCHRCDHIGLLCSSLPSVLCPKVAKSTAKPKMPGDSLGQYSSKNNPTPTTVGEILQNIHTGWPRAHFHTVPQDLTHIIRKGTTEFLPSSWNHLVLCLLDSGNRGDGCTGWDNPMLSLARTQKNQCHVVTGGHQEPDILLPFFWMSSAHGVKEEGGNIFYLSKLLLPHIHNQNSWRLYVLLKPNRSKNTKHRGNTKGRLSKRGRKEGTKQGKSSNLVPDV